MNQIAAFTSRIKTLVSILPYISLLTTYQSWNCPFSLSKTDYETKCNDKSTGYRFLLYLGVMFEPNLVFNLLSQLFGRILHGEDFEKRSIYHLYK
jgi:hypothetical protein